MKTAQAPFHQPVVTIDDCNPIAGRKRKPPVERTVLPAMLDLLVADREIGSLRPPDHQPRSFVARSIVDHQPFDIEPRADLAGYGFMQAW